MACRLSKIFKTKVEFDLLRPLVFVLQLENTSTVHFLLYHYFMIYESRSKSNARFIHTATKIDKNIWNKFI